METSTTTLSLFPLYNSNNNNNNNNCEVDTSLKIKNFISHIDHSACQWLQGKNFSAHSLMLGEILFMNVFEQSVCPSFASFADSKYHNLCATVQLCCFTVIQVLDNQLCEAATLESGIEKEKLWKCIRDWAFLDFCLFDWRRRSYWVCWQLSWPVYNLAAAVCKDNRRNIMGKFSFWPSIRVKTWGLFVISARLQTWTNQGELFW